MRRGRAASLAKTVRAEPFPHCLSFFLIVGLLLVSIQQPAVVGIGSEDCLTLNVWKPAHADESAKLAVLVYIHVRPSIAPRSPRPPCPHDTYAGLTS
jgi:hypothetical protein